VPAPEPVATVVPQPDEELEASLRAVLGTDVDGYGVVALDLKTGRRVAINPDQVFYSASLFKLWVMLEVFHQEQVSLLGFGDTYVMNPYYDSFGLGPRATRLCNSYSVQALLEAMMSVSDNAAAVLLQDLVGAANINALLEGLGLTYSRLTPEDLTITAGETAILLELIASGTAPNRDTSEAMASLMTAETFDNGLVAGINGSEALVAHKTGNWPNARHDAGIVFAPSTTYVLAVLSDNRGGSFGRIGEISRAVYEAFNR
jgi:beta-lactamase class A